MSPKSAQLLCLPLPCGTWFPSNAVPSPPDMHPCAHSAPASGLRAIPGTSQAFSPPQGLCTYCLLLCSFPHHSGLCSDVPFRKSCLDLPTTCFSFFPPIFYGFSCLLPATSGELPWEDICPLLLWGPAPCPSAGFLSPIGSLRSPSFQSPFLVLIPSGPQYFAIP